MIWVMKNGIFLALRPWICSNVYYFIVFGNLYRIRILLLGENCINLKLNWFTVLFRSTLYCFSVYSFY